MQISPIKILAGIAAVGLAVSLMFYASEARQATSDIMSKTRIRKPAANPQPQGATPSGVRVIPISVEAPPSSGNERSRER